MLRFWVIFLFLMGGLLLPELAHAQDLNVNIGEEAATTRQIVRLVALITLISLAPSILVMMTSFVRIVIVFSLLRSAIGLQQTPPNSVLISLALFLTMFIMMPTLEKSYEMGLLPMMEEKVEDVEGLKLAAAPFHEFMRKQVRESDLELFLAVAEIEEVEGPEAIPYRVLIPAFMISELRRAFEIGFLLFIPFLIIDMMISAILMSMGMMMLPPVIISLPFKIIFFVLVDGWHMLSESLIKSFM